MLTSRLEFIVFSLLGNLIATSSLCVIDILYNRMGRLWCLVQVMFLCQKMHQFIQQEMSAKPQAANNLLPLPGICLSPVSAVPR